LQFDGVQFLSFRNNLSKLLLTPYEPNNEWEIDVCIVHGVICLGIVKLDENQEFQNSTHQKSIYWGYKFEDYCTNPKLDEVLTKPVDPQSAKYYTINRVHIGSIPYALSLQLDGSVE